MLRAQEQGLVKDRKKKEAQGGKTESSPAALPPGHPVSAPGDPDGSWAGPGPSPWLRWLLGWWGCSGSGALAWIPSAASERWPGG